MGPFTCDGAGAGVKCSLAPVSIFPHGKNAVHDNGAMTVSCQWTLKKPKITNYAENYKEYE